MKINKKDWKVIKLTEVAWFQEGPGVRRHQFTTNGIKLLNVTNINEGVLDLSKTDTYISEEEAYGKYKHFLVDEGDLVIASSGIKVERFHEKIGFIKKEHLPLCMNTSTIRFKPLNNKELDLNYLAYFFKTNLFKNQIGRLITGSAQLNFGPSHLKQIDIVLPPIEEQKKIAAVLDSAQALIEKRKESIAKLDELIQSVFLDMFGDPAINPFSWDSLTLSECVTRKPSNGFFAKNDCYTEEGTPIIWIGDFIDRYYSESNEEKLKKVVVSKKDIEKYSVNYGDILFCRSSLNVEGIGKASVVPNVQHVLLYECHIIKVTLDRQKIVPEFFKVLSDLPYFRNQIKSNSKTSTMTTISQEGIINNSVILPPLELQEKFKNIFVNILELSHKFDNSLNELKSNFQSLLQRAFKGELVVKEEVDII